MKTLSLAATAMILIAGCNVGVAPTTPPLQTAAPSVVFIGDSITSLWASGPGQLLFGAHPTWIAKGISGQTSKQVLARFESDVIDIHPDIVHILVGTNDVYPGWALGQCDVPAGSSNSIDSPANVTAMVLMAESANISVVLATIPPWETDPVTLGDIAYDADPSSGRYALIDAWNAWLGDYALKNRIVLVDYHTTLEAPNFQNYKTGLTLDGVHPSTPGYAAMTPLVEAAIAEASKGRLSNKHL